MWHYMQGRHFGLGGCVENAGSLFQKPPVWELWVWDIGMGVLFIPRALAQQTPSKTVLDS